MTRALAILAVAVVASGCTTGLGPRALQNERPNYNQRIVRSADEEILLNLVRLRYNDTPLFLELGAIVGQYQFNAQLNASGHVDGTGMGDASFGTGLGYSESPTITYTPLKGEDFATRMLTPLPLNSLMFFSQSGWSTERLLLVAVQRINDVYNAQTASGPTPEAAPDYATFADLASRLHRLQLADLVGLNWEEQTSDKDPPGRNPRFWIHAPRSATSPLAEDVAVVRRVLDLAPGRDEFVLSAFPYGRKPNEVGIRCRSMLGMLYFLSAAVVLPSEHVALGLVTTTRDEHGKPFDWSKVLGDVMTIHSQRNRPAQAAVAVQHRGFWFYLADDDQSSKKTFGLLNILLSLQSVGTKGGAPVLTLPVGQ